ncbi:hypothetical protein MMC30_004884 [Trapelia coarctata]|nr:hypothetical protein [Trapelia coarctata]
MATTTPDPSGSAFPWILDHLLQYPGSYEIPLRTMYTNNILAQANHSTLSRHRPRTPGLSAPSSCEPSPITPQTPQFADDIARQSEKQAATEQFKSCLMEHVSYLPSQPFSLPPSFITSFVRRCFTDDLCQVDFTQALTALDYLKDLETRRKRELAQGLQRLGVHGSKMNEEREEVEKYHPRIAEWISSMEDKERKVEALYTQAYIGLRRWTLINEMRLYPFSKPNCIAMLNTLYPPTHPLPPTPQLTPTILAAQRHAFFRYIQAVEKNGKGVLANLENQSKRPQDSNGWPVVREIVDKYLRTANCVIDECVTVGGPEDFERRDSSKRADSGVSFGSLDRPATSLASYHKQSSSFDKSKDKLSRSNSTNTNKPLPASPVEACPPTPSKRGGSTLERIAREIRRIKSRSADSKDKKEEKERERSADDSRDSSRQRSLRKMRSASALGRAESKNRGGERERGTSGERGTWEIDEAKRRELIREAVAMRERERGKENGVVKNEF